MLNIEVKQAQEQHFRLFNFHHDEMLSAIQSWIASTPYKPLLLEGTNGVGRKYAVRAATHLMDSNHKVIPINFETLDQPLDNIEKILASTKGFNTNQQKLWEEIKQYAKNVQVQNDSENLGWALIAQLGIVINLGEALWDYIRKINKTTFQVTPEDYIAELIRALCQEQPIILHLDNSESSPHATETLMRICKLHNLATHDSNNLNTCFLAINCTSHKVFSKNFALHSDCVALRFAPLSMSDLQAILPTRGIDLPNSALKLLMSHGDHKHYHIYPERFNSLLLILKKNRLLIKSEDGLHIPNFIKDTEILALIGRPITNHYESQLKNISDQILRNQVKEYLALASLFGPHLIPQIPLLYGLGLDYYQKESDREKGDLILDTIQDLFLDTRPALFVEYFGLIKDFEENPLYCYRLKHPIIQDYLMQDWSNTEKGKRAKNLLELIPKLLPIENNARNSSLWHIAQIVGEETQDRWFELLYYHVMASEVKDYKVMIQRRIETGITTASQVLNHAKRQTHYPAYLKYLQVSLDACWDYMERSIESSSLLTSLGVIFDERAEYLAAIDCYTFALDVSRLLNDRQAECVILNNIVNPIHNLGDNIKALKYAKEALVIAQQMDDKELKAVTFNTLSVIYSALGKPEKELEYLKQALILAKETRSQKGLSATLNNISKTYRLQGNNDKAFAYLTQSLRLAPKTGDKEGEASVLRNLALNDIDKFEYDSALEYLNRSLSIDHVNGFRLGEFMTLNHMAVIHDKLNKSKLAFSYLEKALKIAKIIGHTYGESGTLDSLGVLANDLGNTELAFSYLNKSLRVAQKNNDKPSQYYTLMNLGIYHWNDDNSQQAKECWFKCHAIAKELRNKKMLADIDVIVKESSFEPFT